MFARYVGFVATLVALGLNSAIAAPAEGGTQDPPGKAGTMWQACAGVGEPERDRCMLNVRAKDSAASWQCDETMQRARRRCMLDVLERKRPVTRAD
jgi:hypothetical protein